MNFDTQFQYCHNIIVLYYRLLSLFFPQEWTDRLTKFGHIGIIKKMLLQSSKWPTWVRQRGKQHAFPGSRPTQTERRTHKHTHKKWRKKTVTIAGISRQSLFCCGPVKWEFSLLTTNKGTGRSCFPFCLISCTRSFAQSQGHQRVLGQSRPSASWLILLRNGMA